MVTTRHGAAGQRTRPGRVARWPLRVGLAVVLAASGLAAAMSVLPPRAAPTTVAEGMFSAGRAMQHLRVVAAEPHPIGSPAQARVRDHLVATGEALGLPTEMQRDGASGAENVIVRLPGTAGSARDVLITAHYDSASGAPGAGDDGMAVAAMLESMRVLRTGAPLANDVVFLFTDGEEHGQTGIAAFVRDHPAADRVGVAFAFEGLPDSSGTELRTTTPGDAWLVRQLAKASLPIVANSATNTSDRDRVGNDFAAFAPAGIAAAEFLTEGSVVRYHTAGDNVSAIDEGVVQDHGDTMLALARHFGNLDLITARAAEHDLVFFTVPGLGLVAYPVWLARLLAVTAAVALVAVVVWARRRRRLTAANLAWAAVIVAATVALLTKLALTAWQLLLDAHPESAGTLQFPDFVGSAEAMAIICAIAAAGFVTGCHWLSRRISAAELAAGTLLWWLVLALLTAFGEPLFSAVTLWPLVGGVIALAGIALVRRPWSRAALLGLSAVPGIVVVVPLLMLEALNVEDGPLAAVPVLLLLLGSLLPQLLTITGARSSQLCGDSRGIPPQPRAANAAPEPSASPAVDPRPLTAPAAPGPGATRS